MAQPGPEIYETCPYDKSHRVRRSVMATHLYKCQMSSKVQLEKCSFNTNHRIRKEELKDHETKCPDRHSYEASFFNLKGEASMSTPVNHIELPCGEDWDDGTVGGYNPKAAQSDDKENFIIRMKPCLPPAARKAFRDTQRIEAQKFDVRRELFATPVATVKLTPPLDTPLRRPVSVPSSAQTKTDCLRGSLKELIINKSGNVTSTPLEATCSASLPKELSNIPKSILPLGQQPIRGCGRGRGKVLLRESQNHTSSHPKQAAGWFSTGRGKAFLSLREFINKSATYDSSC